jgi:hypothetical protein
MAPGQGLVGLGGPLGAAYALVPVPLGVHPELRHPVLDQLQLHVDVHVVFTSSPVLARQHASAWAAGSGSW